MTTLLRMAMERAAFSYQSPYTHRAAADRYPATRVPSVFGGEARVVRVGMVNLFALDTTTGQAYSGLVNKNCLRTGKVLRNSLGLLQDELAASRGASVC